VIFEPSAGACCARAPDAAATISAAAETAIRYISLRVMC
jgi:hypothetical protein